MSGYQSLFNSTYIDQGYFSNLANGVSTQVIGVDPVGELTTELEDITLSGTAQANTVKVDNMTIDQDRVDTTTSLTLSKNSVEQIILDGTGIIIGSGLTNYTLPLTAGATNQILKLDANRDLVWSSDSNENIYTTNGTLTGDRTLTVGGGNTLTFQGTSGAVTIDSNGRFSAPSVDVDNMTINNNEVAVSGANNLTLRSSSGSIRSTIGGTDKLVVDTTGVKVETLTGFLTGTSGYVGAVSSIDADDVDDSTSVNKFFTNVLARAALSGGSGIDYNSTTGVIAVDGSGSFLPLTGGTLTGQLIINRNASGVRLNGTDHCFMEWYANGVTRNGYIGKPSGPSTEFAVVSQNGLRLNLQSGSGTVLVDDNLDVTGTLFVTNEQINDNVISVKYNSGNDQIRLARPDGGYTGRFYIDASNRFTMLNGTGIGETRFVNNNGGNFKFFNDFTATYPTLTISGDGTVEPLTNPRITIGATGNTNCKLELQSDTNLVTFENDGVDLNLGASNSSAEINMSIPINYIVLPLSNYAALSGNQTSVVFTGGSYQKIILDTNEGATGLFNVDTLGRRIIYTGTGTRAIKFDLNYSIQEFGLGRFGFDIQFRRNGSSVKAFSSSYTESASVRYEHNHFSAIITLSQYQYVECWHTTNNNSNIQSIISTLTAHPV